MDAVGMTASFQWISLAVATWPGDSLDLVLLSESFIYISMRSHYSYNEQEKSDGSFTNC